MQVVSRRGKLAGLGSLIIFSLFFSFQNCGRGFRSKHASFPTEGSTLGDEASYQIINGHVYFDGQFVELADARTFLILNKNYGVDKRYVYYKGSRYGLQTVDPTQVQVLSENYLKDQNGTIYYQKEASLDAHLADFRLLDDHYLTDGESVYIGREKLFRTTLSQFRSLGKGYAEVSGQVIYKGKLIYGVDSNSFEVLSDTYAQDQNYFYSGANRISRRDGELIPLKHYYAKSNHLAFYDGQVIQGAAAETFKVLGGYTSIDHQYVYEGNLPSFSSQRLDLDSLQFLGDRHFLDSNGIYYYDYDSGLRALQLDPSKLSKLNIGFFTDFDSLYAAGQKIVYPSEFDLNSIEVIGYQNLKDGQAFYKLGYFEENKSVAISQVNIPLTAELVNYNVFIDSSGVYNTDGKLIPVKGADGVDLSLKMIRYDMAKDDHSIFLVNTVDAETNVEGNKEFGLTKIADASVILSQSGSFLRVGSKVYSSGDLINNSDGQSFRFEPGIVRDSTQVYSPLLGTNDIKYYGGSVYYNDQFIYLGSGGANSIPRSELPFESIIPLGRNYYRTGSIIRYYNSLIPKADVETFRSISYDYGRDKNDVFHGESSICETHMSSEPETRLSNTCLSRMIQQDSIDPLGNFSAYEPKYPLFTSGAKKKRWIYLPGTIDTTDPDNWVFPNGTILWKEFAMGDRKIETRMWVKKFNGEWQPSTYVWNEEGTDAVLDEDGEIIELATMNYRVPSLDKCNSCHGGAGDKILGFSGVQLSHNQSDRGMTLADAITRGWLSKPPPSGQQNIPGSDLDQRALGYLHTNCGHCHNPNGMAASRGFTLLHNSNARSLAEANGYKTPVAQGVISPGDPDGSYLFKRLSEKSMPPVEVQASSIKDQEGTVLIQQWIESL